MMRFDKPGLLILSLLMIMLDLYGAEYRSELPENRNQPGTPEAS